MSNAMKRVETARHDLLVTYIDRFLTEIGALDQASAQWTLADHFGVPAPDMTGDQMAQAVAILKRNLAGDDDCIVLNRTMDTRAICANSDTDLAEWLGPHLKRLEGDRRKSVSKRASKARQKLGFS